MKNNNKRDFEMAIAQRRERFKMLVPDHISDADGYLNRLAFECDMLLHQNPRLAQCDPKSIMLGAMEAARHKLHFSQNECSLIPFKNQAVFVLGVTGIIRILYRTGLVQKVKYGTVFENDKFDFSEGTGDGDFIEHRKALINRGKVVGAWALAMMKDGTCHTYVMDRDELFKIRNSSPGYRAEDARSPYNMWPEEMYGKAPLKRLFKRLQLDPEAGRTVQDAVSAISSDLTFRGDVDDAPVFFEDAAALEEPKPKKRRAPKKNAEPDDDTAVQKAVAVEKELREEEVQVTEGGGLL